MRSVKSLAYLKRLPEVWRCVRQSYRPLAVTSRYLQVGTNGYPFSLRLRSGITLVLNDFHDVVTAWVVFFRNEYEISQDVMTVVDLGANIGCFSLRVASEFPMARVIAVEPFPATVDRLAGHVRLNALQERIHIWRLAVAGGSSQRRMPAAGPGPSRGLLAAADEFRNTVSVSAISLSEVLSKACTAFGTQTIDFLKMDIEGAEHEAVLATPPSALKVIRRLGLEYHPNQPKTKLFNLLTNSGLHMEHDRVIGPDVGIAHFRRM